MANTWGNNERLYFSGLQNHCRWWLKPWNKKKLTSWKESYDQPNSILKSWDITLPKVTLTKIHPVKAMIFPIVIYGCESWTLKKGERWRIDAFELWFWRRLLRVPWTARRSNQSILMEVSPEYSLEGVMLKLKLQYFGHLMRRADSFEKTLILGKIEGWRRRGWQGTTEDEMVGWHHQLTGHWVWLNSGSWWWTGRPGVLQSMGLQRDRHDWETELKWYYLFSNFQWI